VHILFVEDEPKVAKAVREGLESEHYKVTVAATGEDGFFLATTQTFDLILLDIMLPGRSGLEILRALREKHCQTPVLILTAKDAVEDRVLGLDTGADDYLIKPFAFLRGYLYPIQMMKLAGWHLSSTIPWLASTVPLNSCCRIRLPLDQTR
jgi:two-component system copper resistance phosphate regulon response regulator CusR